MGQQWPTTEGRGLDPSRVPLDELPASVVYDVLQDAATVLTGQYLQRQRDASDAAVASSWWTKVMELRDQVRAFDPGDRHWTVGARAPLATRGRQPERVSEGQQRLLPAARRAGNGAHDRRAAGPEVLVVPNGFWRLHRLRA